MRISVLIFLFLHIVSFNAEAQSFINGDLNGAIATSSNPTSWINVPNTDVNCQASAAFASTPEVINTTGPDVANGVNGNPFSGGTLLSGLHLKVGIFTTYQEGIMQTVTGFTIGTDYDINLHQTVIKASNALDNTGSWSVYFDNTLIGVTASTTSTMPFNSNSHPWELRTLTFTATATSHVIKFLPTDDDANITNSAGGIRMGLDNLSITSIVPLHIDLLEFNTQNQNDAVRTFWSTATEINNDYFTIMRSKDGLSFEQIGTVNGAGNSNSVLNYVFYDAYPYNGISYYQLKQTDFNSISSLSDIVSVYRDDLSIINIYPNPAGNLIQVVLGYELNTVITVNIYNSVGQKILFSNYQINKGISTINIDVSSLAGGVYSIKIITPFEEYVQQEFIKK